MTTSNEHNNAPAVPDGLQWFTVAEHGIPEIGAEVIGGLWYTDPWIKTEFATTFMWGQCRVVESKHRDFKDGKQWCTFGPSHNQITHWARINTPGQTSAPAPAVPQTVYLVENRTCLLAYASREDADKAVASMPASTGMHWTENEPVRLPASRAGRVYMAGPMTGLPELNFPAFNQEAERLRAEGLQVLNPADHGIVDGADWADYLRHDITGLASCERIHLLRGWTKSKGACLEMTIAKALGMTVTYQFDAEMEHNNAPAVPQGWTDADSDSARLALELECLLMDTKDLSVVSKWWASANEALELHRQRLAATPAPAPAQGEPFGYFRAEPFGWTDCPEDAEGAIALYEHPAKPAQEVGLTDDEIDENTVWHDPDPHDNVHCDVSATVRKCLAAIRAKGGK